MSDSPTRQAGLRRARGAGSGAPSVSEAMDFAFSPGGPVESFKGEYRPLQHEFARRFGRYVEIGGIPWVQEARAGVGKSLPLLIGLMFDRILHKRNGLISTLTRALRQTYLDEVEVANRIVQETLHAMGVGALFSYIEVAEFRSLTSFLSPTKIDALRQRHNSADDAEHKLVRYFDETLAQGNIPEFSEYYAEGGTLPANTTELDWCLAPTDRQHPVAKTIFAEREKLIGPSVPLLGPARAATTTTVAHSAVPPETAAVLLVTHALFIRNNLRSGRLLQTGGAWALRNGCAVIDEADKLPPVAADASTFSISSTDLARVAQLRDVSQPATNAYRNGREKILAGLDKLAEAIAYDENGYMIRAQVIIDDPDAPSMLALQWVYEGLESLQSIAAGRYSPDDLDVIQHDMLRRQREEIRAILAAPQYEPARVARLTRFDRDGNPDVLISINFSTGRAMMNQLWRSPVHTYSGTALVSATLSDRPPSDRSYRKFLRAVGFDPLLDKLIEERPLPASRRDRYGAIAEVMLADRNLSLYPIDHSQPSFNSQDFVKFAGMAISQIAKRQAPEQRMLVLFQQYKLLEAVWQQVPQLHPLIIKRQRESNLQSSLLDYAIRTYGIWFGVEWEGVNFVSQHGKTLADIVVIPRIPQPPIDIMRTSRLEHAFDEGSKQRGEGIALNEAVDYAYQRMVQGIARGIRHGDDVIQLLAILDIRFPVPGHLVDTRRIARSAGDAAKLFYSFDGMLDPFNVRRWSQIDRDGNITTILDERELGAEPAKVVAEDVVVPQPVDVPVVPAKKGRRRK